MKGKWFIALWWAGAGAWLAFKGVQLLLVGEFAWLSPSPVIRLLLFFGAASLGMVKSRLMLTKRLSQMLSSPWSQSLIQRLVILMAVMACLAMTVSRLPIELRALIDTAVGIALLDATFCAAASGGTPILSKSVLHGTPVPEEEDV